MNLILEVIFNNIFYPKNKEHKKWKIDKACTDKRKKFFSFISRYFVNYSLNQFFTVHRMRDNVEE